MPSRANAMAITVMACLIVMATPQASAQPEEQHLPQAEDLLDRFVVASGGVEVLEGLETVAIKGRVEIAGANIGGDLTINQARPDRSISTMKMGSLGTMRTGTAGGVAWEMSDIMGPRLLEGQEREVALRASAVEGYAAWRKHFSSVETAGEADVNGLACWKLGMTTTEGHDETWYLDQESFLLRKMSLTMHTALGKIRTEIELDGYQEVEGIMMPFSIKQNLMSQQMVITIESIEYNVAFDDDAFDPPPAVLELLSSDEAETEAPAETG